MTEKEFLNEFLNHYFSDIGISVNKYDRKDIDTFLEEHHKTYYEVEFVEKAEEDKIYVKRIAPIEFTSEQAKTMLDKHNEMMEKYK